MNLLFALLCLGSDRFELPHFLLNPTAFVNQFLPLFVHRCLCFWASCDFLRGKDLCNHCIHLVNDLMELVVVESCYPIPVCFTDVVQDRHSRNYFQRFQILHLILLAKPFSMLFDCIRPLLLIHASPFRMINGVGAAAICLFDKTSTAPDITIWWV